MPIYNDGDTKVCIFGKGDISVCTFKYDGSGLDTVLGFVQDTKDNPIGTINEHHIGLSADEMDTQVIMHFDNVVSVDIVISQLQVIRADLVKMQEEKECQS